MSCSKKSVYLSVMLVMLMTSVTITSVVAETTTGYWTDSSGEIVRNGSDQCYRTQFWTQANAIAACESLDIVDTDKDGIVDSNDVCPDGAIGAIVSNTGCAIPSVDSDNAQIVDVVVSCPNGAIGTLGVCNVVTPPLPTFNNIFFSANSTKLTDESMVVMNEVVEALIRHRDIIIKVMGYTDNVGNISMNNMLSKTRADTVVDYLVSRGIPATRLKAEGYGMMWPIADNESVTGREQNRRVELQAISNL